MSFGSQRFKKKKKSPNKKRTLDGFMGERKRRWANP